MLDKYQQALLAAGLRTERSGAHILVPTERPADPGPVNSPVPDIDAYRYDLLARLAVDLSSAVAIRAARYEYVTGEGRAQIARRVRDILQASPDRLSQWRASGR
jgi:hypothetical protein